MIDEEIKNGTFQKDGNVTNIDSFKCLDEKNNPKKEEKM